jgi:peptide/nickel transport system substrate-binding protein
MEENTSSEDTKNTSEDAAVDPPAPNSVITPDTPAEDSEETDTKEEAPSSERPTGSGYPPVEKPKKSKKGLILLLVLLLAIAGAAYYWFFVRKDNPTTTNTTTSTEKKDVVLIRYGASEGTLNEFYPTLAADDTTIYVNKQMFEGLVGFEDKTKIVPLLATSWTNPDTSTWVFTLKSGVKFHDGNTMTAKDVAYSYKEVAKNDDLAENLSTIKSVEAVDDTHVKITTDGVDPILLNRLTGMPIMDSTAQGKADPKFGTGPYQVKDGTTPDAENIDMVAFDGYHGGHVYTKEVQVKVYLDDEGKPGSAEQNMVADMKNGKLDIVGFVSGDNLGVAKAAGLQLFPVDDVSVYQIAINANKKTSPLSNQKVRQAVYQAIDVDALMKAIGRTGTPASQFLPTFIPGYNSAITRPKYDQAAAKQLLKDAGYPNGTSFTLTAFSAAQDAATEIQRQLKDVGITVKLDIKTDVSALQTGATQGTFDAFYFANGSALGDASDVFAFNFGLPNYTNPEAGKLLEEANGTLDQAKRLDDLKKISKLGMDDTAIVPLYVNQPNWVANKPYVMTQDLLTSDIGVYFYKVHLN